MGLFDKIFGKKDKNKRNKTDLINAYSEAISNSQWGEVIKYGEEVAQVYRDSGDKAGEFLYYFGSGFAYYNLRDFKKAIEFYEKSLEIANDVGEKSWKSQCYKNIGVVYQELGDIKKAIEYRGKYLEINKDDSAINGVIKNAAGKIAAFNEAISKSQWRDVIKYGEELTQIFKDSGDKAMESGCCTPLGAAYYSLGDIKKAIEYYEKSLEINKEIGDRDGESACYTNLGIAYGDLGDFNKAIEYQEKSLEINKEIGDRDGESACYTNLGIAYKNLGDFNKAIEYHEKSLEIAKDIGDRSIESKCYGNLGLAYVGLGDFNKAIEYHEKSLEIAKDLGDRAGESAGYGNLGRAYINLGDFNKAIEFQEKSLEIAKEIGNISIESTGYEALGRAYNYLGDFKKAIEYYEKSLEIAKGMGNSTGESACYIALGIGYRHLGDFNKAIEYHEKSLEIDKYIGSRTGESSCYINLGNDYFGLGDLKKAIGFYEKSLEINKEIGDRASESTCYLNLGGVYHKLGDLNKAIEFYEKALEIKKDIGDRAMESGCYANLGAFYKNLGDFNKAIEYHENSLEIAKDIGDRATESLCYANLGNDYFSLGDLYFSWNDVPGNDNDRLLNFLKDNLKLGWVENAKIKKSNDGKNITVTKGKNSLRFKLNKKENNVKLEISGEDTYKYLLKKEDGKLNIYGDFNKAIEFYEKALKITKEIGDMDLERIINLNLGLSYLDKPELAYNYCQHSIELSEMITKRLVEEEHKIPFFARISDAYQYMIPLCVNLKKDYDAFKYTEGSKSRAFLDLIAATEIKPSVEVTSKLKSLLDDEEYYLVKMREIQTRHLRETKVSVEPGEAERIFEKLNNIYDKIEKYDPEYVFTRRGEPLSLDKVRDMLSSQKRDVVLVEYFTTKNKIFIFVISSKDKELHIETVKIPEEKLNEYIDNYWREVVVYHGNIGDTWLDLSRYLTEPISKYLTKGDLIYFVPYGSLHYLPLHALKLNGEPLIKNHPVAYSPSASLIKFCQSKGTGKLKNCTSFGVAFGKNEESKFKEKLKNLNKEEKEDIEKKFKKVKELFEGESKNIADLFSTNAYLGNLSTKNKVLEDCTDKDIIHFSCHGYFNDLDPLSSGVKLYDGVLTAREIFDMRLNTELVTLSACQTGRNKRSPGDELIGLTRAFLYAGAPSVIVSLWSVDAHSTQELMLKFYDLLKKDVDKATALQEAQKEIIENKKYSHPYYWAPFVLVGDWK